MRPPSVAPNTDCILGALKDAFHLASFTFPAAAGASTHFLALEGGRIIEARYYKESPQAFEHGSNTALARLGIGPLATAAVSLASTVADLANTSAQVVRQAFRLGSLVDEIFQNLEPRDPIDTSFQKLGSTCWPLYQPRKCKRNWTCFSGMDPRYGQGVSALAATSVTISGPPTRLKAMFRTSKFFHTHRCIPLPVYGAYATRSTFTLLRTSVTSYRRPRWRSWIQEFRPGCSCIRPVHGSYFLPRMRQISSRHLIGDPHAVEKSTEEVMPWVHDLRPSEDGGASGPQQSKIAIVGMSCRMPGGATDLEKVWELLEQTLDVHRKIPADKVWCRHPL
ncbi:hypothetical protein BDV11DRAFT_176076 [Aspergillus similis]